MKKVSPLKKCPDREKCLEKDNSMVFSKFFQFLGKIGLDYCVMGPLEELPNKITSDIDIVIDPDSLGVFHLHVFDFCRRNNLKLTQVLQHEQSAYYYVLHWKNKDKKPLYLHLDICSDYLRNGRKFLTAKEILSVRTPAMDKTGMNKDFFGAAPQKEFIYYLLKKVDKNSLDDDQGKHLSAVWAKAPDECSWEIKRFWPNENAELLNRAAEGNDWKEVRQKLPALRKSFHSQLPPGSLESRKSEMARKLLRISHPSGLQVAFLGPDGSGKSSVIDRVSPDLAPSFRNLAYFHFRPGLEKKMIQKPVTNPHDQDPRSLAVSIGKIFYFWFDYLMNWLVAVHPKTVHSTLVLFDRYYHDMIVDPKRYRFGGPMWLARLVGKLIPKPDIWILLDAPPEVLQGRKQEISFEETARQRKEYIKLVKGLKSAFVVDAAQSLDDVVADVNAIILDFMAQRTEKRYTQ
jgi:thymidylate kinase